VFSVVFISLAFVLFEPILEPVRVLELNFPLWQDKQFRGNPAAGDTATPFHHHG